MLVQARDIEVVPVDVFSQEATEPVSRCDGFMWRCPSSACIRLYARRFLYAIEAG